MFIYVVNIRVNRKNDPPIMKGRPYRQSSGAIHENVIFYFLLSITLVKVY